MYVGYKYHFVLYQLKGLILCTVISFDFCKGYISSDQFLFQIIMTGCAFGATCIYLTSEMISMDI